jgi:hypothetical protein
MKHFIIPRCQEKMSQNKIKQMEVIFFILISIIKIYIKIILIILENQ